MTQVLTGKRSARPKAERLRIPPRSLLMNGNVVLPRFAHTIEKHFYNGANVPPVSNQSAWLYGRVWWDGQ